jgi:hypothetical protein
VSGIAPFLKIYLTALIISIHKTDELRVLIFFRILIYVVLPSLLFIISNMKLWVLFVVSIGLEVLGFVLLRLLGTAFLGLLQPMMVRLGRPTIPADDAWGSAITEC